MPFDLLAMQKLLHAHGLRFVAIAEKKDTTLVYVVATSLACPTDSATYRVDLADRARPRVLEVEYRAEVGYINAQTGVLV